MKWYEARYVNKRDWIIENLEFLNLSPNEFQLINIIDFLNDFNDIITHELLCKKMCITKDELDNLLAVLMAKNYLSIKAHKAEVKFILDGLYETETAKYEGIVNRDIYDLFENEFARPLTENELRKINEFLKKYEKKLVIYALREASTYKVLNIPYVEKILREWKSKGISIEKIEGENSFESK
ncbi:MAG: DnaD domain-containing protein [Anaerorhabdus sp.]